MLRSMTGFGKGEASSRFGRFIVELRTVNHRYFDVSSRLPNNISQVEDRIKNYLHRYIKRGKVNFSLSHRKGDKDFEPVKLDHEAIDKYYKMLNKIKRKFRLKDDVKLSHILSFRDVLIQEQPEYDVASVWPVIEQAMKKAILGCNRMREREGNVIYKDLKERIDIISSALNKISKLEPRVLSEYKNKLDSRIKFLLKDKGYDIDRPRLETELAIFARGCDISEELTRANSHLVALRGAIQSGKEMGRRMDFILQELQREINTLGAKANSVKISQLVVDVKSEIEKIREQVQNVE